MSEQTAFSNIVSDETEFGNLEIIESVSVGYVYAPYVPLYKTSTLILDDFRKIAEGIRLAKTSSLR